MSLPTWKNHPALAGMDPKKVFLLTKISEKIEGKSEQDILPILMAAMTSARKQNISFSSQEFEILFSILKEGKSEQEIQQINQTINFAQNILSKNRFLQVSFSFSHAKRGYPFGYPQINSMYFICSIPQIHLTHTVQCRHLLLRFLR